MVRFKKLKKAVLSSF